MSYINFEPGGTLQSHHTLWRTSSCYNTDDLSPQNTLFKQNVKEPSKTANENVLRDAKNRRIITKASLYETKRIPKLHVEKTALLSNLSVDDKKDTIHNPVVWQQRPNITAKLQQNIDKAFSKPLKIDKAASMMAKMGWQGGPLGKSGTGIIEPIIPNATYAMKTAGFGQPEPVGNIKVQQRRKHKPQNKDPTYRMKYRQDLSTLRSNVLTTILEFLQNDFETELIFDSGLDIRERKKVHRFVQTLNNKTILKGSEDPDFLETLLNVHKYPYVLMSQSEDRLHERVLCVYKEAPADMFLVTHYDLRSDLEVDNLKDKNALETYDDSSNRDGLEIEEFEELDAVDAANSDTKTNASKTKKSIAEDSENEAKNSDNCSKSLLAVNDSTPQQKDLETEISKSNACLKSIKREEDEAVEPLSELILNITGNAITNTTLNETPIALTREQRYREKRRKFKDKLLELKVVKRQSKEKALVDVSNDVSKIEEIKILIYEYFNVFIEDSKYSQFKFLGAFNDLELEVIYEFVSDVCRFVNDADYVSDAVYTVMSAATCSVAVKKDCNGNAVIYKTHFDTKI